MTTVSAVAAAPAAQPAVAWDEIPLHSRIHVAAVAFLRVKQLHGGARSRVEALDHKITHLAVLEVLADTISWSVTPPEPPREK